LVFYKAIMYNLFFNYIAKKGNFLELLYRGMKEEFLNALKHSYNVHFGFSKFCSPPYPVLYIILRCYKENLNFKFFTI
jgi:hypothetical protein